MQKAQFHLWMETASKENGITHGFQGMSVRLMAMRSRLEHLHTKRTHWECNVSGSL